MEVKINYGAILFNWISKWFKEKRKAIKKHFPKMYYERFINILLKNKMRKHIGEKERKPLNVNKKITNKLFENWKRNPIKINKSKQFEGNERIANEV